MEIDERIELWFALYGDECTDSEIRDLLNEAQETIRRLQSENAELRKERDEARLAAYERDAASHRFDLIRYIACQRDWSERTFGHSARTNGITRHIEKELDEIRQSPHDLSEWIDVVILALDGAWRAGYAPQQIAEEMERKQQVNFKRSWPPAVDCDPDQPSEHVRSEAEGASGE